MHCRKILGSGPVRVPYDVNQPHILPTRGPGSTIRSHRRADLRSRLICNASATIADSLAKVSVVKELSTSIPSISSSRVEPRRFPGDTGDRVGIVVNSDAPQNGVVLTVTEDAAITSVDAESHELVGPVAGQSSELVALTLWLLAERAKGSSSAYSKLLSTLPAATLSPILWEEVEINTLLQGSPVRQEALNRRAELQRQWQELHDAHFSKDAARFSPAAFGLRPFMEAFSVVLAHSIYLPTANCFALMPVASLLGRTGGGNGCDIDYDADKKAVVVTTPRYMKNGSEVLLNDPRPNSELLLATGTLPDSNPADFLMWDVSLIPADKYYLMKSQILETLGFNPKEQFPVYADRFPNQMLAYLRLSRVADPALFAKVSFEQDIVLSQMNEYEILQLIMGDCREKLQSYALSTEEDIKESQSRSLSPKERLACKMRMSERKVITATMDAARRKLAPIRGIPTKSGGMQDPNSDLKEIFDAIESIPNAPKKLVEGFMSWARGEQDPDWGKKPSDKPKAPRPW